MAEPSQTKPILIGLAIAAALVMGFSLLPNPNPAAVAPEEGLSGQHRWRVEPKNQVWIWYVFDPTAKLIDVGISSDKPNAILDAQVAAAAAAGGA